MEDDDKTNSWLYDLPSDEEKGGKCNHYNMIIIYIIWRGRTVWQLLKDFSQSPSSLWQPKKLFIEAVTKALVNCVQRMYIFQILFGQLFHLKNLWLDISTRFEWKKNHIFVGVLVSNVNIWTCTR